jgi:hypothetical protein
MRTTLTLDDDVAARLEQLRKQHGSSFREIVNQALRRGLREMAAPPRPPRPYRTPSVDLGKCLVGSIDDVADVLAVAEGEDFG